MERRDGKKSPQNYICRSKMRYSLELCVLCEDSTTLYAVACVSEQMH
jgi:hypothetical protein